MKTETSAIDITVNGQVVATLKPDAAQKSADARTTVDYDWKHFTPPPSMSLNEAMYASLRKYID